MDTDSLQAILDELTKMRAFGHVPARVHVKLTPTRGPPAMRRSITRLKIEKPQPHATRLRSPTMATRLKREPPPVLQQTDKYAGHTSQGTKILDYRFEKGISRQIICNQYAPHMVAFSEHPLSS